jgi:hypothetical protein
MRYIVETPWGRFTRRTSSREYQFVVISCGQTEAHIRARHDAQRRDDEKQRAIYEAGIRDNKIPDGQQSWDRLENYPAYLAGVVQRLEQGPGRLARDLEINAAQIAAKKGRQVGWCGRRDLADKEAARALSRGWVNVHIYSCVDRAPYTLAQEVA